MGSRAGESVLLLGAPPLCHYVTSPPARGGEGIWERLCRVWRFVPDSRSERFVILANARIHVSLDTLHGFPPAEAFANWHSRCSRHSSESWNLARPDRPNSERDSRSSLE